MPNYDNVLSYYSSCSPSFFFVWLLSCFMKNLLALCYLCFHVEDNILCMITKTQFTYRKWLHKYFVFFMWTYIFLPFSHWLHNVTPGTLCKHYTYVDSAPKWLIFLVAFISTFRSRHWEFFRKTAVRKDITKTVIFFYNTGVSFQYSLLNKEFIDKLKVKSYADILLGLWSKSTSGSFTGKLLFLHSYEWLLLIIYLISAIKKLGMWKI